MLWHFFCGDDERLFCGRVFGHPSQLIVGRTDGKERAKGTVHFSVLSVCSDAMGLVCETASEVGPSLANIR